MRTFPRYKKNLSVVQYSGADYIQSYSTRVAKIDYGARTAIVNGCYSITTSKHINYACKMLGLQQTKPTKEQGND